jgi:hypothetical protein
MEKNSFRTIILNSAPSTGLKDLRFSCAFFFPESKTSQEKVQKPSSPGGKEVKVHQTFTIFSPKIKFPVKMKIRRPINLIYFNTP